jgi:hypothetical protein
MGWSCGFDYPHGIACWCGNVASLLFFIVYVPQFILNYSRKSVQGFSLSSTVIKLLGSSFLFVNSLFNNASLPVFLYGFLNTVQHVAFLVQFWLYTRSFRPLLFIIIPVLPYLICTFLPQLIPWTDFVKPICQVASHLPQMETCIRLKTTLGVSILGQHLNFAGGVLGCIMNFLNDEKSAKIWIIYLLSGMQAYFCFLIPVSLSMAWRSHTTKCGLSMRVDD